MSIDIKTLHLRICLGAIALMATIPFLMAHHYHPIPSFFQEWVAAAFSLIALTALLRRPQGAPLEVPDIALLPVGLMLIAVIQWLFHTEPLTDRLLMFGVYMVWTIFLIILGRHLAKTVGLTTVVDVLATALVIGTLLESLTGAVQLAGMARMPWFFPAIPGGLRGNLAQPNNFADYLWVGVASVIYLRGRGLLGNASAVLGLSILLPFGVLSGSRSIWLYGAALMAMSLVWTWKASDLPAKTLRNWSIGVLVGSVLFQVLFNETKDLWNVVTSGTRMAEQSYDPIRVVLWRMAVDGFLENPWLGVGFGQYTRYFHLHVFNVMPFHLPGLPENAHNILLQLLVEMGMAAGALLLVFSARWALGIVRTHLTPQIWWVGAVAMVLGIHANLEYPLWYGFFLAIAALVAGAASPSNHVLQVGRAAPYILAAFLVLSGLALNNLYRDYGLLEDALNGRIAASSPAERQEKTEQALRQLADESLLRPYVDFAVANIMPVDRNALDIKLQNCERAQHFSASREIVFKCAHLLALAGKDEDSRQALKLAVASYPDTAPLVLAQWKKLALTDPAVARLVADFPTAPGIAAPVSGSSVQQAPANQR
ncbi:MAG TPA: Wzy polymerase domain-containing protein [Rhodocyclaceae bacterium]|nr:Wzy polymerase domain-containing protein [Rhodocyclaceae bacterium]